MRKGHRVAIKMWGNLGTEAGSALEVKRTDTQQILYLLGEQLKLGLP